MNLTIRPARHVSGVLEVPGNKSISHRAAIFGAVAHGTTHVHKYLQASDTLSTLSCLAALGVPVRQPADGGITIEGVGFEGLRVPAATLDCGNSGTTMRLLLGLLAGRPWSATLAGDASLSTRPMDRVQLPLGLMGARLTGQGTRCAPPVTVRGGALHGITYILPVASAQVKSAVLLAGLQAAGTTTVIEPEPTRDHTERMLEAFGVPVQREANAVSVGSSGALVATDVVVPGDISSAAYFLAAAALRPDWQVTVRGVGTNTTRTGILDVLSAMGAVVTIKNEYQSGGEPVGDITVRGGELRATEIGGSLIPRLVDELPVLALVATAAAGQTVIRDAAEMRVKESDRIAVICRELRKLGADIDERPDGMMVNGPTRLQGSVVTSPRGDHRIAMTLAVAGLVAGGETTLENAEAIHTSFPNFQELLDQVTAS